MPISWEGGCPWLTPGCGTVSCGWPLAGGSWGPREVSARVRTRGSGKGCLEGMLALGPKDQEDVASREGRRAETPSGRSREEATGRCYAALNVWAIFRVGDNEQCRLRDGRGWERRAKERALPQGQ